MYLVCEPSAKKFIAVLYQPRLCFGPFFSPELHPPASYIYRVGAGSMWKLIKTKYTCGKITEFLEQKFQIVLMLHITIAILGSRVVNWASENVIPTGTTF